MPKKNTVPKQSVCLNLDREKYIMAKRFAKKDKVPVSTLIDRLISKEIGRRMMD